MSKKINKLKEILEIPNPDVKLIYPKEFLNKITGLIEKQDENNKANVEAFSASVSKIADNLVASIEQVNKRIDDTDKKIEGIKEVKVTNFPEQKEIVIPEQKEFPKEIEVKKPAWYEKFIPDKLMEVISKGFKESSDSFGTALDRHKKLENALAVRLADSQLQTFYNAIAYASSSGGGTASNVIVNNWPLDYPDAALLALVTLLNNKFVSGTDIGDVTINNPSLAVTGTFWQATQPVSGTVTANLSATDNAVLDDIAADTESIKGYVDGIEALLGTIDADTGNIATYADGINDSLLSLSGAGSPTIDSYTKVAINLAAGANQSLVSAPGANKQIWVYGIGFTVNVAGTVSFQDEDDTPVTGIMQIGATGGMVSPPSGNFAMPLWKIATNKALEVDVVTSELDGWLTYAIVSV